MVALFNAETSARRASKLIGESLRIPAGPSQVGRKAKHRGYGLVDVQFALGDGGAWIWFAVEELCPDAIQILDRYRALQRFSDTAKAVRGRCEMAEALARRWRCVADSGQLELAFEELGPHAPRRGKLGGTASYFENNRRRMDYPVAAPPAFRQAPELSKRRAEAWSASG